MIGRLKFVFLVFAQHVVSRLPWMCQRWMAFLTGTIALYGPKTRVVDEELQRIISGLTRSERRKIILEGFRNFHLDLLEIWAFPFLTQKKIHHQCRFEGLHHLDQALLKKKGALVLVTHFGSWKMLIAALSKVRQPLAQVGVNPLDSIRTDDFRDNGNRMDNRINNRIMEVEYHCEQSLPAIFIYAGGYMRKIFRILDQNGIIIMAVDAPRRKVRTSCPFLEDRLYIDPGPFAFAVKQEIPILPLFPVREKDGTHRIYIHGDIQESGLSTPFAIQDYVQRQFLDLLAAYVRRYPSHYVRSLYNSRELPHPLDRKINKGNQT